MGWLYMRSIGAHRTPRDYLDAELTHTSPALTRSVLRSAVVRMRTYYAALEVKRAGAQREVIGTVCLIRYSPRDREGYIFGYKDMSEDMGPVEAACPVRILDLLTPTDNENAQQWRARCRNTAARRAAHPKLRNGDRISFDSPMQFTDGTKHQHFTVVIHPVRPRLVRLRANNDMHYRVSRLKDRAFTVTPAA